MNIGETGVSLHMVERTPVQPGQGTMFWKVLQEENRRVNSLGKDPSRLGLVNQFRQGGGPVDEQCVWTREVGG